MTGRLSARPRAAYCSLGLLAVLVVASAIVAWAVTGGGELLRAAALSALLGVMALPMLVSLEAGLVAMMLFEPWRGFLRRAGHLIVPYSGTDPIHLLTPLLTLIALATLVHLRGHRLLFKSSLARLVSLLGAIYFIQIFNPRQGGLLVGLSGALFMLVPLAWFYFGQEAKPGLIALTLRLVVVMGLISSLHGLYQMAFGFPSFEQYWIEHTEFYDSIAIGQVKRALATFSSAEEWSRYTQIGAIIAFGLGAATSAVAERARWWLCAATLSAMTVLTGHRTSIFGLLFGLVVLALLSTKALGRGLGRAVLLLLPLILAAVLATPPTEDDLLEAEQATAAVLTHVAKGTLRPTREGSWQERLATWSYLATEVVPSHPLGLGLGAASLGSARFSEDRAIPPVEGYIFAIAITCGLPAALLFCWILGKACCLAIWRLRSAESAHDQSWLIVAALMPVFILNNLFGNTFTLYSVAPLGWLLIGWISAASGEQPSCCSRGAGERMKSPHALRSEV